MDVATVLVIAAMVILAAAFVTRPLARDEGRAVNEDERDLSALYAEQDQVLSLLYDLDTDYAMGKILPEDYERQRAEQVTRGAEVLKEIDRLATRRPPGSPPEDMLETRLETEVARIRERLVTSAGYCGNCGNALTAGDRFCARCGSPVPAAGAAR
ncbi:MAG TPA: zinc ribbon domain-containing protein [Anaerolineales bacterium]|nr:zinc ribbon domain-containing protein [Anaerolineales bacterium]